MGRTSRPERHSQHLPDTPPDSNLSRSPSAASKEISGDKYISRPPRTYRPTGRKAERGRDPHSHSQQYESRASRVKPCVHNQTTYQRGGTSWDDGIGRPIFKEHHKRQSERLPGNGDQIFVTVGIDTQRHFRRASLTIPQPPGKSYFSSSRENRISQESSRRRHSGYHSRPHVPPTDENHRDIHTDHSNGARRDPRERTSEGTKKRSNRGQENTVRPELTVENVTLNARCASSSNRSDARDVPTRRPYTTQATARRARASESQPKSRALPSNGVPIKRTEDSCGEPNRSTRRGDTYPSRNGAEKVRRGRRMERKEHRKLPVTAGDDREEEAAYRSRSPPLASYSVDRRSKPTRPTRRSSNGHRQTPKELGLDSSPPTSDLSDHTDYSVRERRRTVKRKSTQQTSCSCTVS